MEGTTFKGRGGRERGEKEGEGERRKGREGREGLPPPTVLQMTPLGPVCVCQKSKKCRFIDFIQLCFCC